MEKKRGMTRAELLALPTAVGLETAARACGISRTLAYNQAKHGRFPVRVMRFGKTYRVARADLLRHLGEADEPVGV